jgi:hypothetical protein
MGENKAAQVKNVSPSPNMGSRLGGRSGNLALRTDSMDQMLTGLEDMPPIQLHELVDQLDCGEDEDPLSGFGQPPPAVGGVLASESFWRCCKSPS